MYFLLIGENDRENLRLPRRSVPRVNKCRPGPGVSRTQTAIALTIDVSSSTGSRVSRRLKMGDHYEMCRFGKENGRPDLGSLDPGYLRYLPMNASLAWELRSWAVY
jgi:hypothetical protein